MTNTNSNELRLKIEELRLKVTLEKAVPYWWRFAYLIPDILLKHHEYLDDFAKTLQGKDTAFSQFVQTHVQAYIQKGTLPPDRIAASIINIAEDILAGREPVIRAGDYIALQNQMRGA